MKKGSRVKNYIFGIILLCLLTCGVCVDEVSTGSFWHAEKDMAQEVLMPDTVDILSQECWDEDEVLLQQRDLRLLQYTRSEHYRGCWRNIFDLLLLGFSLPVFVSVCRVFNCQYFVNGFNHKFIIGYIHRTDGEKSC